MFGAARPAFSGTSNFSGFGSTNQQSTGFGTGGSAFGRAPFGTQSTGTGFGIASTSTPFGGTTNTGSSLFGTAGQTGNTGNTGLFGSQVPGAFSTNKPTGFTTATSNTGTSLFGTQNTAGTASTGLFGSSTTSSSNAFGMQNKPFGFATPTSNTTGGGLFNTSSTGGLFGANTGTSNVVGTTVKYQPVTGSDTMTRNGVTTNIQTRIEVITCMKEYESKSLEELRVEDYLANRKGPGQGGGLMTGAFGQNTGTTGGLFGATNSNTGGLFGQKPAENKPLFGATNTGFAAASSSGGGLFGSTSTAAPAFGQAVGTSSSTGGFSFGQNTQQNKPAGGFSFMANNNATSGGGLFGQQQQQPTNTGFGATNTGFSFGQNPTSQQSGGLFNQAKPAFGATTSTAGGLFGSKPATSLAFGGLGTQGFGTTSTASPFGTSTSTSGGLFGNTQNKPAFGLGSTSAFGSGTAFNTGSNTSGGGLFGNLNTNTGGGLFSNTANQNKPAGGLAFNTGSTFNSGSNSLGFGFNTNANKPTGFGALGGGFGTGGTLSLGGNTAGNTAVAAGIGDNNIANLIKALTDNPFGHSSLLKTPAANTGKADELLSPPASNANKLASNNLSAPTYVLPSHKSAGPQPRANTSLGDPGNLMNNRSLLFAGLDDTNESNGGDEIFKTKTFPSVKKLNLKVFNSGKNGLASLSGTLGSSRPSTPSGGGVERGQSPLTSPLHLPASPHLADTSATPDIIKGRNNIKKLSLTSKKPMVGFNDTIADLNVGMRTNGNQNVNYGNNSLNGEAGNISTSANVSNANYTIYEASSRDFSDHDIPEVNAPPHPTGIKLSRAGYYTIPSMSELASLIDEDGRCVVENFSVGREGYGNVCFTSETDVMGLDLDCIVFIVRKEIEVYPDGTNKPKVGEELNKPAVITLDAVWPIDKSSRDVIKDADRLDAMGWPQYLEKKCLNMGAKFLEYRPDTGSWVFKVSHFSKYGLEEDDSEELCAAELLKAQQQQLLAKQKQQQQAQQQQQPQGPALDAYPRKTTDASLIKSVAGKAYSATTSHTYMSDGGEAESTSVTPATTSSSGSLSTSSSGLGGGGGSPTTNGGGPPTQGLLSPPPVHHLLPGPRRLRDSPSHLQQQNLPSTSGSPMLRSTAAAATAPVPGEMFMDSFANEPHEGASMGLSFPPTSGARVNLALQHLTANLFPMDKDEDLTDAGDGYGTATLLPDATTETTLIMDGTVAKRSAVMDAAESSAKKFAGRRLELGSITRSQEVAAGGLASQEGRLSPSAGGLTLLRPKTAQLPAVSSQAESDVPESHYRGPRSEYPAMPSGGGAAEFPVKVAPQHCSAVVPLHSSIMDGQHRSLCDHAAYMGRRCRVGWGPSFRLLHAGQPLGTQVDVVTAAASAREKRLKRDTNAQRAVLPYLFLSASGPAAAPAPVHSLPDLPEYNVRIERLHLTDLSASSGSLPDPSTAMVGIEACLREVLRCSAATQSSASLSAPLMLPTRGRTLLHRLAATVQSSEDDTLRSHPLSSVFELCMALWGKLDYGWLEEAAASSVYVQARARVETVSQWLESACHATVEREVQVALEEDDEEAYLDAVFSRLTAREIQHACELLQDKGDHHLALLLAQVCMGDDTPRQIVAKQLSNWAECSADATLSPSRLLLYVLAAGKATHTSSKGFVNVCKGLDWRRSLAVHLWYVCPSTCTVSEALAEYERGAGLLKDANTPSFPYCQEPVPQYLADHTLPDSASQISYDICYHLLKLYTDPAYRLDQLLNPAAITPDPLDVTASWLVMALIHSLGYDRVNPIVSNGLHLAMAAHLESVGLWHWAVFALLSLKEEKSRASEVRALLTRHVQILEGIEKEDETFIELHKQKLASCIAQAGGNVGVAINATNLANYSMEMTNAVNGEQEAAMDDDVGFVEGDDNSIDTDLSRRPLSRTPSAEAALMDESIDDEETAFQEYGNLDSYEAREAFVVTHLKIPEKWINESKAILARSFDMVEEEAWYLIKANDLDAAHKLFVDTIAPDAIINEKHKYLQRFITAFEASSDDLDVRVADWKIGGAVYAHYLHVLELVDEIKSSQHPSKDKVEALRPRLLALCSQLNSLRTPTAKHRLCVSEVSRVVVGVLRAVLGDDLAATTAVANQIASLPLSKDCALQELNTLIHQYLAAVSS